MSADTTVRVSLLATYTRHHGNAFDVRPSSPCSCPSIPTRDHLRQSPGTARSLELEAGRSSDRHHVRDSTPANAFPARLFRASDRTLRARRCVKQLLLKHTAGLNKVTAIDRLGITPDKAPAPGGELRHDAMRRSAPVTSSTRASSRDHPTQRRTQCSAYIASERRARAQAMSSASPARYWS